MFVSALFCCISFFGCDIILSFRVTRRIRKHEVTVTGFFTFGWNDRYNYFSTNAKSSCFFSRLARATLMVIGSPKLNFL